MKTYPWIALIAGLQTLTANAQILRYQFNEGVGTSAASSGSVAGSLSLRDASGNPTTGLWGSPGSGVSGLPTDRALDLNSATGMGSGFTGPNAFLSSLSPVSALDHFTLTGWFRPSTSDLGRANFLSVRNGSSILTIAGLSGGPGGASRLRLIMDNGDTFPEVDAFGDYETQWSTPGVWGFFGITYDAGTVRFYSGDIAGSVSLSAVNSESSILFPFNGASMWIGATPTNSDPFKGFVDDVRLYGSALSLSDLEQVRLSAVPEPSSAALLCVGTLMMLRKRLSRSTQ